MIFECRQLGVEIAGRPLLRGLDFEVRAGEVLALRGPSGAGKTTALRALAGLIPTGSGTVRLDGRSAGEPSWPSWRRRVSLLPQRPALRPDDTILRALERPFEFAAVELDFDGEAARALLAELGLAGLELERRAGELSEGQRQRVALARSLLLRPTILLLDEPSSALDADSKARVIAALERWLAGEAVAAILVSHDERAIADLGARALELGPLLVDAGPAGGEP